MENLKMEKAFIAANKYIVKEISREGAGVLVSYDEEIEKSETKRVNNLYTKNVWFDIEIPERGYFLVMDKPLEMQSGIIRENLLSPNAISFLFYGESQEMNRRVEEYISDLPQDKKLETYNTEMADFYERKRKILLDLDSGLSLMNLITEHTKAKDIELSSAFLNKFGILGSLYKDEKGERVIIFDAKKNITLEKRHCEKLEESVLVD